MATLIDVVVKYVRREISEIVRCIYLTKKIQTPLKLLILHVSCPKPATASPQQCAHSTPDFTPHFAQICSLSAEL